MRFKNLFPIILLPALFLTALFFPVLKVEASGLGEEIVYAYLNNKTRIYEKSGGDYREKTALPATYFVALLDETQNTDGYYPVSYLDITGFIKAADLEITDYEPVTKYAQSYLTAYNDGGPVNIRSAPDHQNNDGTFQVSSGTRLFYYGETEGTAPYPEIGKKWYFVRAEISGNVKYGYIYSAHVSAKDDIADNKIEKVNKNNSGTNSPGTSSGAPSMNKAQTIIFIVVLCIPAVVIMLFLFSPNKEPSKKPRSFRD